jgi:ribosome-associated translation inhibitor RaiA
MFDDKNTVTVIASSVAGNYSAENTIEIPVYKPKIIFYKRSPTEGVLYNNALDKEATMTEEEVTIVAEPYYLPIVGNENDFTYSWKINSSDIQTPIKKTELTVRPTSHDGYATIDMTIENLSKLFQKVSNALKLNL